jgi:hypothetical protein
MYGESELVLIAADSQAFIDSIEMALEAMENPAVISAKADSILRGMSWDKTWQKMYLQMEDKLQISPANAFLSKVSQTSPVLLGSS